MLNLAPWTLVVSGIFSTAIAQILLKRASAFDNGSQGWLTFLGLAAVMYVLSFLLYSQILKHYALNKIYPALTVAQIVLITLYGLYAGEVIDGRDALGLLFGIVSIYLILS